MKTIELHGILAKKFGRFFRLEVKSAREATHALACQIPAFREFMVNSEGLGYRFAIFLGKKRTQKTNIGEEQIDNMTTANHIHIVPRVMGSGGKSSGWLQVIVGAWLVVGGIVATSMGLAPLGTAMIGAGAGMIMGGVATLLMPTPRMDERDEEGNRANNGFGGAITTIAQGNPVPILYGEREVGGFIASASIYAEDKMIQGAKV